MIGETGHDYLKALANNQINWLRRDIPPARPSNIFQKSDTQNSPDAHIALYEKYLDITPDILPEDERMTRSTLWHWDMHASNFFVKDDRITSLIDWQSTWAGPLFLQYRTPKLVKYTGDLILRLPENYRDMEERVKERVAKQVERSLVQYFYELRTQKRNPLLAEVNNVPHGTTRRQTIEFAGDTWEGDILPFRQCLIRLEKFVVLPCFPFQSLTNEEQIGIGMK